VEPVGPGEGGGDGPDDEGVGNRGCRTWRESVRIHIPTTVPIGGIPGNTLGHDSAEGENDAQLVTARVIRRGRPLMAVVARVVSRDVDLIVSRANTLR